MIRTLYSKDVSGGIRIWEIEEVEDGLLISHGTMGGSMQEKNELIMQGKASRTKEEQIRSRLLSRVNLQYDKGYVDTLLEAKNTKRTNRIGFLRPMLAKPIKNVKNIDYTNAFYQHKYDGNRCLITNKNGEIIAYSRNGKVMRSIGHITSGIKLLNGQTIDGELYCHGVPLQKICSWIKREQDATLSLTYRMYDIISDQPYKDRLDQLRAIVTNDKAEVVPTVGVGEESSLDRLLQQSLEDGYEGGILRWGDTGYEDGKRSNNLTKIKVFEDDEFLILNIEESKDGWARLVLEAHNGESFTASAPGTMGDKYEIMDNADKYIGQYVNVKFANLTKDGLPFHPIATAIRNKHKE